jgi:hypothetical protein
MTTKTNQYADPNDILGLRFECRNCRALVVLPLSQIIGGIPKICFNCKSLWSATASRNVSDALEMLVSAIRQFQQFNENPTMGFAFSLELTREADSKTLPASHVSDSKV